MKIIIIMFVLITQLINCYCQVNIEQAANQMKYWKLRGRLTGDDNNKDVYNGFMQVGNGIGMSIPAASRGPLYGRNNYVFGAGGCQLQQINGTFTFTEYDLNGNPITITPNPPNPPTIDPNPLIDPRDGQEVKGILSFSDNSLINIGNYIGILATEWALLHRDNKSTAQTEKELFYALAAVDRLDENGESLYGIANDKNGFCMRTDVDEMFQLNTTGKNIDLVTAPIACVNDDVDCTESNTNDNTSNAMSQDEVIGLMIGFSLMRKCMPYYASYNGVGLRQWSKEITERIIKYVKKGGSTNFWAIVDPAQNIRVCRGSKAFLNSYALAAAAQYICDQPFQNGWSLSIGKMAWIFKKNNFAMNNYGVAWGLGMPTQMVTDLGINQYEYIDVPGYGIGEYDHDGAFNASMFLKLLTCSKTAPRPFPPYLDFTGKALINTVSQTYEKHFFELLGSYLYGYNPQLSESYWRGEFNKLKCGCNCIQGTDPNSYFGCENYFPIVGVPGVEFEPVTPSGEWMVEDRWAFRRTGQVYPANNSDPGTHNEFNGMDYMLAYNLYKLKYFAGGYADRVRRNISNTNFPHLFYTNNGYFYVGNNQYPLENKAVFSIESNNTILESDAKVYYFAGSDIKLGPGFHAKPGSFFKADIRNYDCTPQLLNIGGELINFKQEDTSSQIILYEDIDTVVNIQLDGDSVNLYDDSTVIDSNAYILVYTNNIDTFIYDLAPDYSYSDSGEIIYTPPYNKPALDEATINNITLFPNPSSTLATVEYTLYQQSEVKIIVTNELGQPMQNVVPQEHYTQAKGKQKITLQTANLSPGIYFCLVELNGRRQVLKFSVLR